MKKARNLHLMIIAGALCVAASGQMELQAQDASNTGTQPAAGTNAACTPVTSMNKCSRLIGITVQNPQGEKLGKIKDVVVDLNNGRVSYCVLSVDHRISATPKYLAVPIAAFQPGADGSRIILIADKDKVAQAQGFDANNWPAANSSAWGGQPFWQEPARPIEPSSHGLPRVQ
jgi:sporulation protein YlmC with PRC-barrel domain